MIAVEWADFDAIRPIGQPDLVIRTGVLLHVMRGRLDGSDEDVAYVATKRMQHDTFVQGHKRPQGDYPTIIKKVKVERLIVKGVHIPFEPHGGGK